MRRGCEKVFWDKGAKVSKRVLAPPIRNEKAAQRVSFGARYPTDVHVDIPADVQGQKLRSGPRNPGKTSILVRTSMTRRRGRPRPEGGEKKKLRSEKLRAEFSFPNQNLVLHRCNPTFHGCKRDLARLHPKAFCTLSQPLSGDFPESLAICQDHSFPGQSSNTPPCDEASFGRAVCNRAGPI